MIVLPASDLKQKLSLKRKVEDMHGSSPTKKPCYHRGTIYEAMLSPLIPSQTLPIQTTFCHTTSKKINPVLQAQLSSLIALANEAKLKAFLQENSDKIDINQYGEDGVTPLQRVCQAGGEVGLVRLLIRYGANARLTSRDGWSVIHMATYSGNTSLMLYLLSCAY